MLYHTGLGRKFQIDDQGLSFGGAGEKCNKEDAREQLRGPVCNLMAESETNVSNTFGDQYLRRGMGDQRADVMNCCHDEGIDVTSMLPPKVRYATNVALALAFNADFHLDKDSAYGHACGAGRLDPSRTSGKVEFQFRNIVDVELSRGVSVVYWSSGVSHRQCTLAGGDDFVNGASYTSTATMNHVAASLKRQKS
eukprot:FR740338.1.p1 GENE.FR740338.1~~FR740338.1.p1  ORF type:complete len:195 (+),score=15.20 FR740338.1:1-585(+)